MLRITLNKPAVVEWFGGDQFGRGTAKGLQIKLLDGNKIMMRPTKTVRGDDIVQLSYMERGGAEVVFSGSSTMEVAAALINPYHNPYFTLTEADGWLRPHPLKHASSNGRRAEPARTIPSLRVYSGELYRGMAPEMFGKIAEIDWRTEVREAYAALQEHGSERPIGRPSVRVNEARQIAQQFESLAFDVLPAYRAAVTAFQTAAAHLGSSALEAKTAAPKPLSTKVAGPKASTEKARSAGTETPPTERRMTDPAGRPQKNRGKVPEPAFVDGFPDEDEHDPDYARQDEYHGADA